MTASSVGDQSPLRSAITGELRWVVLAGVIALVLAVALTVAVAATSGPLATDVGIARFVQEWFPVGQFAGGLRSMNNTEALSVGMAIAAVGLWFSGRRRQAVVLVVGFAVLVAFTLGLKFALDRARPDPALIDVRTPGRSPSYPSGHAITSATVFGYLAYIVLVSKVDPLLRAVGVIGAMAMVIGAGVGTIFTGVHWPSDVWGGYLWGVVLVACMIAADRTLARKAPGWPPPRLGGGKWGTAG
jgi:membrane-associated phospholipid phosphatase